jgi:hypothetical protein
MRKLRAACVVTAWVLLGAGLCSGAYAVQSRVKGDEYTSSDPGNPIRAYVYADHTVVELESYKSALTIVDDSGGNVGYSMDGHYANLAAKLNHFAAYVNGRRLVFTRKGWEPPRPAVLVADAGVTSPTLTLGPDESVVSSSPLAARSESTMHPKAATVAPASSTVAEKLSAKANAKADPAIIASSPTRDSDAKLAQSSTHDPLASDLQPGASAPVPVVAAIPAASASAVAASSTAATVDPLSVESVTIPGAGTPESDPAARVQTWQLAKGEPIGKKLSEWAARVHWTVDWEYPTDIIAPADTTFTGDFYTVSGNVIQTLHKNGALIYTHFYKGDNVQRVWKSGSISVTD